MPPILELQEITKRFPGDQDTTLVLDGVTLSLERGQTLALTGESGSGKSTLLHIAAGLEQPDGGHVLLQGVNISQLGDSERAAIRRDSLSIVFQQFNLIPSLTVGENISFQARLAGRHDPKETDRLADRLGLRDHLKKYPEQLSGGQQQRTAIARALAVKPQLVLADEPTGNLDEALGEDVIDFDVGIGRRKVKPRC